MCYKSKKFKKDNYFILYDLSDNIICYFDNFNELSKILPYKVNNLVYEFNHRNTNPIVVFINNKKYKLATFC